MRCLIPRHTSPLQKEPRTDCARYDFIQQCGDSYSGEAPEIRIPSDNASGVPFVPPSLFLPRFHGVCFLFLRARWQLKPTPRPMKSVIAARISRWFAQGNKPAVRRQINFIPAERRSTPRGHSLSLGGITTAFISRKHGRGAEITLAAFYVAVIRDRKDDVVVLRRFIPVSLRLSSSVPISPFVNRSRYVGLDLGALDASFGAKRMHA